jgi:hypothetical protein
MDQWQLPQAPDEQEEHELPEGPAERSPPAFIMPTGWNTLRISTEPQNSHFNPSGFPLIPWLASKVLPHLPHL